MQASKWIKIPVLLDHSEMELLLQHLESTYFYQTWRITCPGEEILSHTEFLRIYSNYIESLKSGSEPDERLYQGAFSSVLTNDRSVVSILPVKEEKQIVQVVSPAIQMRPATIGYSPVDGQFRSMIIGKDRIIWGIEFSYPGVFQSPESRDIEKVDGRYSNTALFKSLKRWIRQHTMPTPFVVEGKRTNVPMRLGKSCLTWINCHPKLKTLGIECHGS
ncbi:MAG: hypothetical protein WD595_00165 [Waddliaceae bacterium]